MSYYTTDFSYSSLPASAPIQILFSFFSCLIELQVSNKFSNKLTWVKFYTSPIFHTQYKLVP